MESNTYLSPRRICRTSTSVLQYGYIVCRTRSADRVPWRAVPPSHDPRSVRTVHLVFHTHAIHG
jgi:hypothetical protein